MAINNGYRFDLGMGAVINKDATEYKKIVEERERKSEFNNIRTQIEEIKKEIATLKDRFSKTCSSAATCRKWGRCADCPENV